MTHSLLILARNAGAYHRLVDEARLPDLQIRSSSDPEHITGASECDLAFGEPSLLATVLPKLTSLGWLQATWAGVEPLLDPKLRRDYVLTNARGVFGGLMSEYVFAYLLAHERLLLQKHASQQARQWDKTAPGTLRGKLIGIVGVGSIGAALAKTAKHFGMRVHGYTRASETCADVDLYFHSDQRLEFARDLDYLVTVAPNTTGTRQLVDAAFLAALPARAVFVNPGRGSIVDEAALAAALREKRIAGAVLDVFQTEPLPPTHELWRAPNVLITSHTAALSHPVDIAPVFVENYRRLLRNEPLNYQVDFEQGY
ncbi:MAG: D-2-hydroxyacid dehydrogenase [Acidobacteria bacterium]|nr:D-2-hydroxyacid dehydrogenase [Acidobacteriota bacterium]